MFPEVIAYYLIKCNYPKREADWFGHILRGDCLLNIILKEREKRDRREGETDKNTKASTG